MTMSYCCRSIVAEKCVFVVLHCADYYLIQTDSNSIDIDSTVDLRNVRSVVAVHGPLQEFPTRHNYFEISVSRMMAVEQIRNYLHHNSVASPMVTPTAVDTANSNH